MSEEDRERLLDDIQHGNELTFLSAAHELLSRPLDMQSQYDCGRVICKMLEFRMKELAKR
jgi:hypothetical protein